MHNEERINQLQGMRERLIAHLLDEVKEGDWHGVSDAANDLRCVDIEIKLWRELPERIAVYNGTLHARAGNRIESKPPAQRIEVPHMEFTETMGAKVDQSAIHDFCSDLRVQRFIIAKYRADYPDYPPDGTDYEFVREKVEKAINSNQNQAAGFVKIVEEYEQWNAANANAR